MTIQSKIQGLLALSAVALLSVACGEEPIDSGDTGSACDGGKCDTPTGSDDQCKLRMSEVLDSSNRGFTSNDIRWACADVEGVNTVGRDDRGQEYCEYFAIFQPPAETEGGDRPEAVDLARNLGGGTTEGAVCFEGDSNSDCRVTLTEDQQFALEDEPDAVVGSCVFTSWHADVPGPMPACADGECGEDAQVYGFPFTEEFFRMKVGFNSNRAAADLVAECFALTELDELNDGRGYIRDYDWEAGEEGDSLRNPFFRGCVGANALFGTGWRRSDPSVCTVANRLRECGCTVPGLGDIIEQYKAENATHQLAEFGRRRFSDFTPIAQAALVVGDLVVPSQPAADGSITKRGFELATWDDREGLPPGCKYAETGEDSQSIVLCDITAGDLLANANDPKEFCRSAYGNNVVVHVPLPAEALECNAPDNPQAASCGQSPWNIGEEGAAPEPEPEPDPVVDPPDLGDCEQARDATGCENECVQSCVCDQDDWCCNNSWDSTCVGEVTSFGCATQCAAAG
jgi:hypothetical protein